LAQTRRAQPKPVLLPAGEVGREWRGVAAQVMQEAQKPVAVVLGHAKCARQGEQRAPQEKLQPKTFHNGRRICCRTEASYDSSSRSPDSERQIPHQTAGGHPLPAGDCRSVSK
jgi:hypothetical protein